MSDSSTAQAGKAPADAQARVDALIRDLQRDLDADQAAYVIAVLANRSAAELHRLANAQAKATKGEPSWGGWASLQNAARRLVLDATSARDGAAKLAGRQR
jgi:hypothetical protein